MNETKIGILGNGFVGNAIKLGFSSTYKLFVYDINPQLSFDSFDEVNNCDYVFVCVPTPMFKDGSQDLSNVLKVFENASQKPIYIIKSTIIPGTTDYLLNKFPDIKIIFSPEFLREKHAKYDILNLNRVVLGGDYNLTEKVKTIFLKRFKNIKIIQTDSKTSELIKYMNNSFLATKISFMNEFKLLCNKIDANWEDALKGFLSDERVGNSHVNVPGHDGKNGYGGTCFPKDVNAIISFSKKLDIEMNVIEAGWKTNLNVRPEKDWENNYGRSVNFKK
tara:strand:- start:323 stop:1153 length:831 start_codon:yes stop_codon:yes gene_type:complete